MRRKAGYDTISDIGKERIRRVIANMQEDEELARVQKIWASKFLNWQNLIIAQWNGVEKDTPESYAEQLRLFSGNPLVKDWIPEQCNLRDRP